MMHIFGIHEWSARFFSSLCSFLGILLLYYTVRHVSGKRIALMATAILTGTLYYTFSGHVNYLDNVLAFFYNGPLPPYGYVGIIKIVYAVNQ